MRIVSLEITDSELKAAAIETNFRDYKVTGLFRQPVAPEASLPQQLRAFLEKNGLAAETVVSALPGDRATWRTVTLPFRDRKKVAQTLPFEIESHIPFDLDEVVIDYQVLHRDRAGTTLLAGIVPRAELASHLETLTEAGIDPKTVDLAPLAAFNALTLLPDRPATFAFVELDSSLVAVALQRTGQLVGLRTLNARARSAATNGGGPGHGAPDPDALAAEVRWTLLALNGAPLEDGLVCYVAGEASDVDVLAPVLSRRLGCEVRRVETFPLKGMGPEKAGEAPAFSSSLGLALREAVPTSTLGLNFRRGEFAYRRSQQELRRALRGVLALAAAVVALTVTDLFVQYSQLASQANAISAQVKRVVQETVDGASVGGDPIGTLQTETDALQQQLDTLNGIVPLSSYTSLDILNDLSAAIPNQNRIDCEDFMMDADAIRLKCNVDNFESVDTIKQQLSATALFSEINVRDVRANPKGGVDFRMTLPFSKNFRPQRRTS